MKKSYQLAILVAVLILVLASLFLTGFTFLGGQFTAPFQQTGSGQVESTLMAWFAAIAVFFTVILILVLYFMNRLLS